LKSGHLSGAGAEEQCGLRSRESRAKTGWKNAGSIRAHAFAQWHFPEDITPPRLYKPSNRGFEDRLAKRLDWLADRKRQKGS